MPANEKTTKKPTVKGPASKKSTGKKKEPSRTPGPASASTPKRGDLIVIESEKVGSPPREGEVLEVVQGQISVSYLVRWQDGHQSLIAPGAGNTRIVPSQRRR